jgi:ankyrin repeat protein
MEKGLIKRASYDFTYRTLGAAASNGNLEVVKLLVESPNSPKGFFIHKDNALLQACENGKLKVVKYLINTYPSFLKKRDKKFLHYCGCVAAKWGHTKVLDYLFSLNHPDFNPEILKGGSLLCYACITGNLESLKYLFSKPGVMEHINIHCERDLPFKHVLGSADLNAIKYLIFDLNINKTNYITELLDKSCKPVGTIVNPFAVQAQEWFKVRDFKQTLDNELNHQNIFEKKKLKI